MVAPSVEGPETLPVGATEARPARSMLTRWEALEAEVMEDYPERFVGVAALDHTAGIRNLTSVMRRSTAKNNSDPKSSTA